MERRRWGEDPWRSLDYELKKRYGRKLYKLSLNGGMTCPNRDGTLDSRGCIFCSAGGSGEFAADAGKTVSEQLAQGRRLLSEKTVNGPYIAYFQAFTNTYGPAEYLKALFEAAMEPEDVSVLSIATRPDCLPEDVLTLLAGLNRVKPVWVELGLQTIHGKTAEYIRRGYGLECFDRAVEQLKEIGIEVIVHVILGLPGEGKKEMLQTIGHLNELGVSGVKLQLLHVLEGTDLAEEYRKGRVRILSEKEYISLAADCLEALSPEIVVHRLTGDGSRKLLLAPEWSLQKKSVLNGIRHEMKVRGSWQGCRKEVFYGI